MAVSALVAGCSPVTEQLFRDQTWIVLTTGGSACGMAAKPEFGQHLLVIYVEGSAQRLELEGPPAATVVPEAVTQVSVDAGPSFQLSLPFAPLGRRFPIIAAVLDDAQNRQLMAALVDHRLHTLAVSFPDGERWQVLAPAEAAVSSMAECRSRVHR